LPQNVTTDLSHTVYYTEDHHLDLARYFENVIWEAFTVSPWPIPTLVKIQQPWLKYNKNNGHF